MGRVLVLGPVTRQERHSATPDLTQDERRRGLAERRVDVDLLGSFEERVEARPADDSDLRGPQADFSFASPPLPFSLLDSAPFDSDPFDPDPFDSDFDDSAPDDSDDPTFDFLARLSVE